MQDTAQPAAQQLAAQKLATQPAAQPVEQTTPQTETQETPPADTTPVLRSAPSVESESIQGAISTLATNATEVSNWFEPHKPQLVAGGISTIVTVLFSIAILLSLRHIISRGA
ncbi:MAG: hypothetical protein IJU61_10000, partial [Victivallales bacterium]|nr:hypothetical protein [Victivallales bacterium]